MKDFTTTYSETPTIIDEAKGPACPFCDQNEEWTIITEITQTCKTKIVFYGPQPECNRIENSQWGKQEKYTCLRCNKCGGDFDYHLNEAGEIVNLTDKIPF